MKKALDKIFFSTEINKYPASFNKKIVKNELYTEEKNHNAQIDIFEKIKDLMLDDKADPLKTRQTILSYIRQIDDKLDNIGLFDNFNSGEALKGEIHTHDQMQNDGKDIENQDVSSWKVEEKNNPKAAEYNTSMSKVHEFFKVLTT